MLKSSNEESEKLSTEWENIFANHISDTRLVSKIKNNYNSTTKRKLNLKMDKGFEQTFLQKRYKNSQ